METIYLFLYMKKSILFKSYYVVWKQSIPCEEWFNVFGLNRTMQYGNAENPGIIKKILGRFKSYYVVWKLFLL